MSTVFYAVAKYISLKGTDKDTTVKDLVNSRKEVRLLYVKEVDLDYLQKMFVITAATRSVLEESGDTSWLEARYVDQDLGNNNLSAYPI